MDYGSRYCAFVDILGFSELINRLGAGTTSFESLRSLLRAVHAPPRGEHINFFKTSDLRAQSISDALCLSSACSANGLAHIFYALEELTLSLLEEGFFIRGAIVKGRLYHDEHMVFGDALVGAYRLEQDVSRFPRIMVTREVAKDSKTFMERDAIDFDDRIEQGDDGPYYLYVLQQPNLELEGVGDLAARLTHLKRYNRMATQIQRRFEESVDNPRHFEKVQWFARYWNRTFGRYRDEVKLVDGPGTLPEPAVWG